MESSGATVPTDGVRLATPADDAALRALLRRAVMPGAVQVAFTREPSYAAGQGVAGATDATVVWQRDGALTAMGRCSVRTLHRNGTPTRVAYLGELRFDPTRPTSARGMRDGYAALAEFAAAAGAEGCFTSIAEDNARARRVLENGGRLGLPAYRPLYRLVTLLAPLRRRGLVRAPRGAHDSQHDSQHAAQGDGASAPPIDELTGFLESHARRAQLSLTWDAARWQSLAAHGIRPADFVVVRANGGIVAAAAVWDQRAFRQTVIAGYDGVLGHVRPAVNAMRALTGAPRLPTPGESLAQGSLLGATVASPEHWPALWRAAQVCGAARGLSWLALARDAEDAELPVLRHLLRPREYRTTLYDVLWRDRPAWREPWHVGIARPEVALL
jgi:hypothetical protein